VPKLIFPQQKSVQNSSFDDRCDCTESFVFAFQRGKVYAAKYSVANLKIRLSIISKQPLDTLVAGLLHTTYLLCEYFLIETNYARASN